MSILHDAVTSIEFNPLNFKITVSDEGCRIQYYVKTVGWEAPSAINN